MEAKLAQHRDALTADELELAQLLQSVGIHNPVTKCLLSPAGCPTSCPTDYWFPALFVCLSSLSFHFLDKLQLKSFYLTVGFRGKGQKEREFHAALAHELATAMVGPLETAHGMLALPDVYCIHSRMRGTQLVAPSELRAACELLGSLNLGMRLRTFDSGVVVLSTGLLLISCCWRFVCTDNCRGVFELDASWVSADG